MTMHMCEVHAGWVINQTPKDLSDYDRIENIGRWAINTYSKITFYLMLNSIIISCANMDCSWIEFMS